eukprot:jgi/Psemu1/291686/fgenesh1_pg.776_\
MNMTTKELVCQLAINNISPNFPVTQANLITVGRIFGRLAMGLKGKTVRRPEGHVWPSIATLPPEMMSKYHTVAIGVDIMFVNKIWFFVTLSRHIQFSTVEMISNTKATTLAECMKGVQKRYYAVRGFSITTVTMNNKQSKPIQHQIEELGITPNFMINDEHVPEIERRIRTIKEWVVRSTVHPPIPEAISPDDHQTGCKPSLLVQCSAKRNRHTSGTKPLSQAPEPSLQE